MVERLAVFLLSTVLAGSISSAQSLPRILPLRITELNYNPTVSNAYEFIELQNIGSTNLDLSGFAFDGITYTFSSNSMLAAGARLVLASDAAPALFAQRYPGVPVAGHFTGMLGNDSERVAVKEPGGRVIVSVNYRDGGGWPKAADGLGFTLEIIDPDGDPDDPANWRSSAAPNGTPGSVSPPLAAPSIVFNEVMAENFSAVSLGSNYPDWVELFNPGATNVDLTGWSFTDDGDERKFVFPQTNLPSGGFLIIWCDNDTNAPGLHSGFVLNKTGETLTLYDATTNRVDSITYGFQARDLTVGWLDGVWRLTLPTPGASNAAAATASPTNLILNEWLVDPAPGKDDWFELLNRSTHLPVALRDLYFTTTNAVFRVQALSFLEPGQLLQMHADENAGPDHVDFRLPSVGGEIAVLAPDGPVLDSISYGPLGIGVSQGRLPDGSVNVLTFTNSASPGASNYVLNYTGPVLNEFMARNVSSSAVDSTGRRADWVELFNPNAVPFDLAGMRLSEGESDPNEWLFPTGTVIAAHGFLVIWCDPARPESTNAEPDLNLGRPLAGDSGAVFLFDTFGRPVDSVAYGTQISDRSLGRTASGWELLGAPTPGASNAAPAMLGNPLGLRVNEWMAFPPGGNDWFELFNTESLPVRLSGLYLSDDATPFGRTNTLVAPLSFIAGRGYQRFEGDGDPSQGANHVRFNLSSFGESLLIYSAVLDTNIDRVDFMTQTQGQSEGRLPDGDTNIITFSLSPTPGTPNSLPIPPSFLVQPQNLTITQSSTATFSCVVTGLPLPSIFRLRRSGTNVFSVTNSTGAAQVSLALSNVQPDHAGATYRVFVQNPVGSVTSGNLTLTVLPYDGDGDGLPDDWEMAHGLDKNDPLDGALDSDHDGLTNLQEYRAGTNPQDALSVLRLDPQWFPDHVVLQFLAVSNRIYSGQFRASLANEPWATWTNLAAAPSNRTVSFTNSPLVSTQRFFRVVTP